MQTNFITVREDVIEPEEFNDLRASVGWEKHRVEDIRVALLNSSFIVIAREKDGRAIGMGRVIGDLGINYYIRDVIVVPQFQCRGLGRRIMDELMRFIKARCPKSAFVGLMAAKGKEGFYRKYGFIERPCTSYGAGMCLDN